MSFYHPRGERGQLALTAQGLITENVPRQSLISATLMIDGTAYFMAVGLRAGDVISKIAIALHVGGTTMSLSKVGLYTSAGARLAVSADQAAAWATAGIKNVSLATPYTVTADGGYYAAVVAKASTLPTGIRGTDLPNGTGAVGSGMGAVGVQTGQTDLPATATIAVGSGSPISFWVGLS